MGKKLTRGKMPQKRKGIKRASAGIRRVEEVLRESEGRYRTILESIEEGYYEVDIAGNLTFFNDALCTILGYSRDELMGTNNRQYTDEETARSVYQVFNRIYKTGEPAKSFDWAIVRKDGTKKYVEISASLIKDAEDKRIGFRGIVRDVTDRKEAEKALRASEANYRSIFNAVNDAVFVHDMETGEILDVNQKMCEMFDYTPEEALRINVEALSAGEPPYTQDSALGWIKKAVERGPQLFEWLAKDHTGRLFWVEVNLKRALIEGEDRLLAVVRDITERKRAEAALRESEEKYRKLYQDSKRAEAVYRSLLESSADAIVTYDIEGRAKYVNPAFTRIFGWTLAEVEGKRIPFLPDSEKKPTMEGIRKIMGNGIPIQGFETKRYTKKGRVIDVNISGSRYDDHQGNPAGMLVILRDTSEKKLLEKQVREAQKIEAIGTLAGGIAHDFNNLLMAIQGNASLMLDGIDPSHPHYRGLKNIELQVKSGARLSAQLLGFARKGKYEVKPTNLNKLVEETADTFQRTKKEIRIHRELSRELFIIEADQGQIEQVLLNLYVNAADAMPAGGDLYLKTTNITHNGMKGKLYKPEPGNYVLLEVTDTGTGMDKETQDRIFDPFFTTKDMGRGTGLGLASVYGIVKGHGGYIEVQSEKGQGATFRVYFPASDRRIQEARKSSDEVADGSGTVLLVDDEEMVLDVGIKLLERLGYTLLWAQGGKDALRIYEANKEEIDLVILDMIMPDMGGGETYDKMKQINPEVKVLLSSGYSIGGKAKEILDRGCDGFIQKPFGLKELSHKVREILGKE